jgi:4-amino-4-deoxy-L-arabinose transferase-like glycosyltransferase
MPWLGAAPEIPALPEAKTRAKPKATGMSKTTAAKAKPKAEAKQPAPSLALDIGGVPWRTTLAFMLLLVGEGLWLPPDGSWQTGVPLGLAALGLIVWAAREGEWRLPQLAEDEQDETVLTVRRVPLVLALLLFGVTLFKMTENTFTLFNVSVWLASVIALMAAFWQGNPFGAERFTGLQERIRANDWNIRINPFTLAVLLALAIAAFFRFSQLATVPMDMQSDHAEKLLDVLDVLNGKTSIFFPRNTGREALQFYLTAGVAKLFGTGLSFLSLKIGTAGLAFLSLIYIYLLGKEFGGRWVGVLALLLAGMAFWPNVISRAALRFALYPAFAAPALYYFLHGVRRSNLNDYLLAGLFTGIGLYGYSPFRVVPVVLVIAFAIYWFHERDRANRRRALLGFAMLVLVALVVFAPMMRYTFEHWDDVSFRALSRMGTAEREFPGSPVLIFLDNLWDAIRMPVYSGGNIWLVGVLDQPALDLFSGALFMLGVVLVGLRYARSRRWQDLFLLLAVPLLMLPSIMSLAFPDENPAMNRASGATIPIFIICAFALVVLVHAIKDKLGERWGKLVGWGSGVVILIAVALLNYGLVFEQYNQQYAERAWNASQMGELIHDFSRSVGSSESVWVLGYPHWVDSRLVAFNASEPGRDYIIWPDTLGDTLSKPAPKLFLLNLQDAEGLAALQELYPEGVSHIETNPIPGRDFLVYYVGEAQ